MSKIEWHSMEEIPPKGASVVVRMEYKTVSKFTHFEMSKWLTDPADWERHWGYYRKWKHVEFPGWAFFNEVNQNIDWKKIDPGNKLPSGTHIIFKSKLKSGKERMHKRKLCPWSSKHWGEYFPLIAGCFYAPYSELFK